VGLSRGQCGECKGRGKSRRKVDDEAQFVTRETRCCVLALRNDGCSACVYSFDLLFFSRLVTYSSFADTTTLQFEQCSGISSNENERPWATMNPCSRSIQLHANAPSPQYSSPDRKVFPHKKETPCHQGSHRSKLNTVNQRHGWVSLVPGQ
jgi:hypothetical protein